MMVPGMQTGRPVDDIFARRFCALLKDIFRLKRPESRSGEVRVAQASSPMKSRLLIQLSLKTLGRISPSKVSLSEPAPSLLPHQSPRSKNRIQSSRTADDTSSLHTT